MTLKLPSKHQLVDLMAGMIITVAYEAKGKRASMCEKVYIGMIDTIRPHSVEVIFLRKADASLCSFKFHANDCDEIELSRVVQILPSPVIDDHVFDMKATNRDVYEQVTKPLVDSAVSGFNATIFAYGQTSSGKTHTMMGSKTERGVLELVVNEIFDAIESNPDREYLLRVSFIEIYQEQITDLLTGSTRLKVSDAHNEVVIKELSEEMCSTPDSVIDVMKKGEKLRHIACTNMNERSSRSHTIFRIIIESRSRCETGSDEIAIQLSHLNLVDLAGSEKVNQTGATGGRFKEGCAINHGGDYNTKSCVELHIAFNEAKTGDRFTKCVQDEDNLMDIAKLFARCAKERIELPKFVIFDPQEVLASGAEVGACVISTVNEMRRQFSGFLERYNQVPIP
ncbi:centromere-associated protein E-like [Artemia franciscana]|uniref:centromere-associated protein E-like n=1 Tax=Artemia franciscana TaxID=6661 RepID=UPI0032DAEDC8